MPAPLDGIRILDLSELLPGPFATQLLTDLGASVLKVERPPHGDNARQLLPEMFRAVNRGKQSIALDLKTETGRATFYELVKDADILVEGYRPGVMTRLKGDYETLAALNPRLIYASITGYGATGHMRLVPGHDLNYQAQAGAMAGAAAKLRKTGEQPDITVPIGDMAASLFAVNSILAAIIQRGKTGEGQYLDISMTDATLAFIAPRLGLLPKNTGDGDGESSMARRPAYGLFPTLDGEVLALGALEDHFFIRLMKLLGLEQYTGPEYQLLAERMRHEDEINLRLRDIFLTDTCAAWIERLVAGDIPVSRVADPHRLDEERLFRERNLIVRHNGDKIVRYPVPMKDLPDPNRPIPAYKSNT